MLTAASFSWLSLLVNGNSPEQHLDQVIELSSLNATR